MASLKEKRAALVKQLEEKQGLLAAGKADGDTIAFVKNALAEIEGIDRQMDGMKQTDDLLTQIGQLNAKSGLQHVGGSDAIHAKSVGEYYVQSMQTAGFDVKSPSLMATRSSARRTPTPMSRVRRLPVTRRI